MLTDIEVYSSNELSHEEYLSRDGLSASKLKLLLKSPRHFKNTKFTATPAMNFGTLVHEMILEDIDHVVEPEVNKRTKAGKAELEEFKAKNQYSCSAADKKALDYVKRNIEANETVQKVLSGTTNEMSIFGKLDGVPVKCRIDAWRENTLIDLKTSSSATPQNATHIVRRFDYDMQLAWYGKLLELALGIKISQIYVIFIESNYPYEPFVCSMSQETLMEGMGKVIDALDVFADCRTRRNFDFGYTDIVTI